jgi:Flp pilus assembly protein TadD
MPVDRRPPAGLRRERFVDVVSRAPLWWIPVAFTLLWAIYAFVRRPVGDYAVETDFFGDYVPWSREWMTGHPSAMNGFKGPVYYLLLGLGSRLASVLLPGGYPPPPGVEFAVGKILSFVSAGLVLLLAGKIVQDLLPRPADDQGARSVIRAAFPALLVQVVLATNVDFIDHAYRAATDLVSLALAMVVIWFGLRRGGWASCLAAGVLAGLACLVRYSNVALLPGIMGLVMLAAPPVGAGEPRPLSAEWRRGLLALAGFVAVSLPWWLFLWNRTGNPFYNRNPLNGAFEVFGRGLVPYESFMSAGLPFDASWLDLLRADAGRTARVWLGNVPAHFWYDLTGLLGWPVALLALGGWGAALARSAKRGRWILLASLLVLFSLVNVPIFYGKRFALPMLPLYALGVGGLAFIFPARAASRRWVRVVLPCLAALGLLVGQVRGFVLAEDPDRFYQPREVLVLRDVLAQKGVRLDPTATLASRKPHAAYWLGVRATALPEGEVLSTILGELRRSGVRYLYVGSSDIRQRPALEPLANPARLQQDVDGLARLGAGLYFYMGNRVIPGVLYEVERGAEPDSAATRPGVVVPPAPAAVSRRDFVRFSLGRFYQQQGRGEAAAPLLWKSARSAPRWRAAQEWAGDAALFRQDFKLADTYYGAALAIDPASPTAVSRMAALRLFQGRSAEAEEALQQALELEAGEDPGDAGPVATVAEIGRRYYDQGEYGAALAPLLGAASLDSTDWKSEMDLGFIARDVLSNPGLGAPHLAAAYRHMPVGPERSRIESLLRSTGGDSQ